MLCDATPLITLIFRLAIGPVHADASELVRNAFVDHRCALQLFECSNEESDESQPQVYLFPKSSIKGIDPSGAPMTRFMCAYGRSNGNSTSLTEGFTFRNWMKIGEKYTTAAEVFRCFAHDDQIIQSPAKKDLCVLYGDTQIPVTCETMNEMITLSETVEKAQCAIREAESEKLKETSICHAAPKSLADLPQVHALDTLEYNPNSVIYFDSGKDIARRAPKNKSPSYPHGWCETMLGDHDKDIARVSLSRLPFLTCPCSRKGGVSFLEDYVQLGHKFTHQEWSKGKRIRKKHVAGHPGYDHSLPYSCDQICAPHFGFTKKEIQTFPDRQALLDAIQKRHEFFDRHENDPTKTCFIPKGARKKVGCRCAIRNKQRTPVKGTSRSYISVNPKSSSDLNSPNMVSASAPMVSSSFAMGDTKMSHPDALPGARRLRKVEELAAREVIEEEDVDEGAESWFPLFLSWSYSAACGSGSTSALCEWWDFLQCITESTALALSTICDALRWTL
ncbi:hypothetical protein XU18_1810 [Perkinsela sp. CCAP 1560/4]|nr:hypothetical protein XU18_1810 [Perkinsela sp. CCAP 1560/4]|eukprot:KNH07278.1 hypothetical protein XU18_1810 [Perkinsela sp. CCAP 1560/4]